MHHLHSVGKAALVFRELVPAFLSRNILSHKLTNRFILMPVLTTAISFLSWFWLCHQITGMC